ncbi:hypothetical protein HQ544_03720 [Candidatus Falkowbacteria bacterium]|nr:hypothetical protein [Candidatus Falkowbacteria bacterium]
MALGQHKEQRKPIRRMAADGVVMKEKSEAEKFLEETKEIGFKKPVELKKEEGGGGRKLLYIAIGAGVIIIGVVLVLYYFLPRGEGKEDKKQKAKESIVEKQDAVEQEKSGWQAVFLTNGQTYFGKVKEIDDNFLMMEDIYYLKRDGGGDADGEGGEATEQEGGIKETKLVKFGTEAHKPMDELRINMTQVLMIEELSQESEIVVAIQRYEEEN